MHSEMMIDLIEGFGGTQVIVLVLVLQLEARMSEEGYEERGKKSCSSEC